jgi:small-conductance mechanosensitive channel
MNPHYYIYKGSMDSIMRFELLAIVEIIMPLAFVAVSLLAGLIFDRIFLAKLEKIANLTGWEGDDIIIKPLRGMSILWFAIAGLYGASLNYPINPPLLGLIHKVLLVGVIISGTVVAAKIASGFVNLYARRNEGVLPATSILTNLTKLLVFIMGILIVLQSLGISITPVLTALGVGGLAVALAMQDTLSNIFSGIYLIISRHIKPGDYVKLETAGEGYIADIAWRNTTIRTLPNNTIIVPNAKLASAIITNYDLPDKELTLIVNVGVSYDSDLDIVEKVTAEVAKEVLEGVPGAVAEFEPVIRYQAFGDFSINFAVALRAREFADQILIKHEFIKRLHRRYKLEKIEIPFPIRTVYMKEEKPNGSSQAFNYGKEKLNS